MGKLRGRRADFRKCRGWCRRRRLGDQDEDLEQFGTASIGLESDDRSTRNLSLKKK